MKILFDHNLNRHFRKHLTGHEIKTTHEMGWEQLGNGKLIAAAADGAFDAFLSIDKKIRFEQNLARLPLPIIVLNTVSNALTSLVPFAPHVQRLLSTPLPHLFHLISIDGSVTLFGSSTGQGPASA